MLTDEQILKLFWKDMKCDKNKTDRDIHPEFRLEDLISKVIIDIRRIKNPTKYDPRVQSPNPEFYNVIEFNDGCILLTELIDYHDGTLFDSYLYNRSKNKVLFTRELFG